MGAVGVPPDEPDSEPSDEEQSDATGVEAERVIRHRILGHEAALKIAADLGHPEALEPHVEETEHRLAEDEDILDEIGSDDTD